MGHRVISSLSGSVAACHLPLNSHSLLPDNSGRSLAGYRGTQLKMTYSSLSCRPWEYKFRTRAKAKVCLLKIMVLEEVVKFFCCGAFLPSCLDTDVLAGTDGAILYTRNPLAEDSRATKLRSWYINPRLLMLLS